MDIGRRRPIPSDHARRARARGRIYDLLAARLGNERQQIASDRVSGTDKLLELGLTAAEIAAIFKLEVIAST